VREHRIQLPKYSIIREGECTESSDGWRQNDFEREYQFRDIFVVGVGGLCPEDLGVLYEDNGTRNTSSTYASLIATDGYGELCSWSWSGGFVEGDADSALYFDRRKAEIA